MRNVIKILLATFALLPSSSPLAPPLPPSPPAWTPPPKCDVVGCLSGLYDWIVVRYWAFNGRCGGPCPSFSYAPLTIDGVQTGLGDRTQAFQAVQNAMCPGGQYLNGALQCTACPIGTTSYPGSITCSPCPGSGACSLCPQGSYGTGLTCTPCPINTYGTTFGATDSSSCLRCPSGLSSPSGATQCFSLLNSSMYGTSCRSIKAAYGLLATTGWYKISPSSTQLMVYCDMTADSGAAYTLYPCNGCTSVNMIDSVQANGCTGLGLNMVIPRSEAHWTTMFAFVANVLNASVPSYFQTVPGISKPTDGLTSCLGGGLGVMNSANCLSVTGSWQASDGGQWWLRDTAYSQPDGNYASNSLLALGLWNGQSSGLDPTNLGFDDGNPNYAIHQGYYNSGLSYLCSTNDQLCLPGSYSSTGYEPCSLCSAGTFSLAMGAMSSSTCHPCSAGTYSIVVGGCKLKRLSALSNGVE